MGHFNILIFLSQTKSQYKQRPRSFWQNLGMYRTLEHCVCLYFYVTKREKFTRIGILNTGRFIITTKWHSSNEMIYLFSGYNIF